MRRIDKVIIAGMIVLGIQASLARALEDAEPTGKPVAQAKVAIATLSGQVARGGDGNQSATGGAVLANGQARHFGNKPNPTAMWQMDTRPNSARTRRLGTAKAIRPTTPPAIIVGTNQS